MVEWCVLLPNSKKERGVYWLLYGSGSQLLLSGLFFFIKLVFNNVCYTVLQINGSPISAKSDILFSLIACTVWVGFLWAPVKKLAVLDRFFTIIDPTCGLNRFLSLHEAHQLPPQP